MKPVVVFLGPTLGHDEARAVLDAQYLPPAGHGDVLRAALHRPRAILLVDGLFDTVPAVWHKEILFALSEGIHVYGAASMGALRAAELDPFGMRGVGAVYRAFADGTLEDDDEVAVAQADAEHGFRALSDSMVDVRATLDAAVAKGIVDATVAAAVAARVKATFYPQRRLVAALDDDEGHERLRTWLRDGWVQRKRDDAVEALRVVGDDVLAGLEPFRPGWTFQRTRFWDEARRVAEQASAARAEPAPVRIVDDELEGVLDEYRLDPGHYSRLLDRSLLVALALDAAADDGGDASPWAQQTALDRERLRRGQLQPEETTAWLEQRGLSGDDIASLARRLAALSWTRQAKRDAVSGELPLALRTDDAFTELAQRAARKRAALAALPAGAEAPTDEELLSWYFHERLQQEPPPALESWAAANGWSRPSDLLRTIRAEWRFGFHSNDQSNEIGGS